MKIVKMIKIMVLPLNGDDDHEANDKGNEHDE